MADSTDAQDNGVEKLSDRYDELITSSSDVRPTAADLPFDDDAVESLHATGGNDDRPEVESEPEPAVSDDPPAAVSSCPFAKSSTAGSSCSSFMDLLLWCNVRKTCTVFVTSLVVLISLALFSIVSVLSYLSLTVLTITFTFRLYWHAMCSVKKIPEESPFKKYLDVEFTVSDDSVHRCADLVAKHLTKVAQDLRRLYFVENVIETLKFGLVLWVLTYIGGWFNGITLIIIGDIILFTVPKVYDMYKTQIDELTGKVCSATRQTWTRIQDKIPSLSKKKQA